MSWDPPLACEDDCLNPPLHLQTFTGASGGRATWIVRDPRATLVGYNIYRSTDPDLGFRRALQVADPNAIWVADHSNSLGAGIRYYYDLDAYSTDGSLSDLSEAAWAVPKDAQTARQQTTATMLFQSTIRFICASLCFC